ncbi:MAG: ACP S-malonyltransferase [Deltaproteobacteria bacterium]|nr:ACP S-malonyltransferase [Deltaproteobacteria bacterium]
MSNVFLFPGQGSQHEGMGKNLFDNFKIVREVFDEANDTLHVNLQKLCFEGPESELKLTFHAQPALLTVSFATYCVLVQETGVRSALLAGHSLGEYSALVVAGVLEFSKAVWLVRERGLAMQKACAFGEGGMAALIGISAQGAKELCEAASKLCETNACVVPANFNGGGQVVVSGHKDAIEKVMTLAKEAGVRKVVWLDVSAPFHSPLMKPAAEHMARLLNPMKMKPPKIPYIANVDAQLVRDEALIKDKLIQQIPSPVAWEASMMRLGPEGITQAYEIGAGKVLTGLLRRINKGIVSYPVETTDDIKVLAGHKE